MLELTCGICLDDLKSPVSTPCGHLHCKKCIHEHVKSSADAIQSTCPVCRSPFYTVNLDPTYVPEKYHSFIIPSLRRIYLNADPSRLSAASRQLQEQLSALKEENEDLVSKLEDRDQEIKLLTTKYESNIATTATLSRRVWKARLENERLQHEMSQLAEQYEALQVKFSEQEHRAGSSRGGEAVPNDNRRDCPWNQTRITHRPIPDPSRSRDFTERPVDEPVGETDGTSTVVNKRKYTTLKQGLRAWPPLSSPPSSPSPKADREENAPGERPVARLPRRSQVAKRPRLGLDSSGDANQERQTLAPPPVFNRRRPPTPFNHPRALGGTGGTGDQAQAEGSGYAEGNGNNGVETGGISPDTSFDLSSDESLDLVPRRR